MSWKPPIYANEELVAGFDRDAAHWERVALESDPDTAFHCRDYAAHLRTLALMMRMDLLEKQVWESE